MVGKDKLTFRASHHVNAITFLLIGILFVFTLVLNQNHTAIAQQQKLQGMQNNQMPSSLTKQQLLNGNSFQIDNMTFSHRPASVNGIQLHYVIGGHGNPVDDQKHGMNGAT